jgi:CubicO group peptidase (beta-lactamase class C family)
MAEGAVRDGVVPGLAFGVSQNREMRFWGTCGLRQSAPLLLGMGRETLFDTASLTKALVTSLLVMQLIDEGRLSLRDRVSDHCPAFAAPAEGESPALSAARENVKVFHLLSHSSGLPAHRPYYAQVLAPLPYTAAAPPPEARSLIVEMARREPLVYEPGTRSLYCDLGFILLGAIIEKVAGARLDALADVRLFHPLGLRDAGFRPLDRAAVATPEAGFAATERCPIRGRLMVGEVHDQNAWAMAGVAGHAGLFASLHAIFVLAHELLACHRGESGFRLVNREVLQLFWRPAGIPGSTWRLGWDGPSPEASQAGDRLDRSAVGHLGFTGTSVWIDATRESVFVLLTNRLHPELVDPERFRAFRPALHDAAVEALGDAGAPTSPPP